MKSKLQRVIAAFINGSSRRGLRAPKPETLRFETLESRRFLAAVDLADFTVTQGTGEKPQSKVWEYDNQWWTVMPSLGGTSVWRLDGTTWTQSLQLSTSTSISADVKSVGNLAHILLFDGAASQLASIEYDGAGNYVPWTMRPQLIDLALSGAETATIDLDTTGRLWVAADNGSLVQVRYADGLYQSWSSPITVASGISSDDISVITALPNGTVGVLWSNQNTKQFGFSYHIDGAAPMVWSADETPASAAALNVGGGMADDHLHVAVAADGTLYAAVKTSYDSGGQTKIGLIVRRPNGQWDNVLYPIDTSGTRPVVLLNETAGKLIVAYAASEGTANIVYRESTLASISFGPRQTMISGSIQNVSSTKQNFSDEVVLIASNGSTLKSVLFSFGSIVINQPPSVDAGADRTVTIAAGITLSGSVQDDGLPGATTVGWSKFSGPGSVAFDDPSKLNAKATFSVPGTYVLRIVATDGQSFDADQVTMIVEPPAPDPSPSQVVSASFQDGVAGYSGTRDTMIRALNANTNYGTLATLEMDASPDIASLVAWDVSAIPAGSTIISAAFELFVANTTVHSFGVYAMERAWDELGATWNIAQAGQSWATAGASAVADRDATSLGVISSRNTGTVRVELNAAGRSAVQEWINHPLANNGLIFQNYGDATDGLDFRSSETSTVSQRPRLLITYSTPTSPPAEPQNAAPIVNAGADRTIVAGQTLTLTGTAVDDGTPGPLTLLWSKQSGPGSVTIGSSGSTSTQASFSTPGAYVLRLTASDGALSAYDELTVTVVAETPTNLAPTVSAGSDRTVALGSLATLNGSASDDGLPGALTTGWMKISGPGAVTFGNAASPTSTASFSQAGTYVLRLTARDGQLSAQDDVTITVPSPPSNTPVTASFQDGVGGYAGTRDTMLRALNASTNYGSINTLEVDGAPDIASLLSWDLSSIPAGSTVLSATLELYVTNATQDNYQLLAMERAWREYEATWNQAGNGLSWTALGASATGDRAAPTLGVVSPRSTGGYVVTLNAAGIAAVQRWVDNPTVNFGFAIQNYASAANGLDFRSREAADAAQRPKLVVSYQPAASSGSETPPAVEAPSNQPPDVFAGVDRTAVAGVAITLNGIVNDDGPAASVSMNWSRVSGPGAVQFSNGGSATTSATFSAPGSYVLRLTANDGSLTAQDDVFVEVTAAPPANQAPTVSAGQDQTARQDVGISLTGSVTDDGPLAGVMTVWTKTAGPGNVTFSDSHALQTHAAFSTPGVYVMRLTADDGSATAFDEVSVTIEAAIAADPTLVGDWEMEAVAGGAIADSSGAGRSATIVGSPSLTPGLSGNALNLSKGDRLLVDDAPTLNPGSQITISAWIKPAASGTQYVVRKGRQDATDGYELGLSSDGKVFVRFNQATSGDAFRVNSTSKYPTTGTVWLHVAATYDGSTIKLYINGVLQASRNAVFQIAGNTLPLSVGAQDDGLRGYVGAIDGVKLFNRALSAAEIAALKANG